MRNKRNFLSYLYCVVFLLCVLMVNINFISLVRVYGNSMSPTLNQNDFVLIRKISEVKVNDVVVIEHENGSYLIKRVIGVGGDKVIITDDTLMVNDEIIEHMQNSLDEEYLCTAVVPEDSVFVLGDNRLNSIDSRNFGCVNIESIIGIVILN